MSSKRDYSDVDDGEISEPETKRAKQQQQRSSKSRQHQHSSMDPTWGQKYVFSSYGDATTIPKGEESDFEDDADAMAYLMSVRQEAYGIPHLLVAPKVQIGPQLPADAQTGDNDDDEAEEGEEGQDADIDRSIYTNGLGDTRGWYEDGAYIAAADSEEDYYDPSDQEEEEASAKAIHEAYLTSLLDQYNHLRVILNANPPSNARSRLPRSTPVEAAPFGRNSRTTALWSRRIRNSDPLPLQLALMTKDSVLRVLRVLLGGKFLRRGYTVEERTSRWLWALLARLPERGGLNHTEIGWIRDLGRRAVLLSRSLAEMAALREELEDGGLGANEGVDGSSSDDDVVADELDDEDGGVNSPSGMSDITDAPPEGVPVDKSTQVHAEDAQPEETESKDIPPEDPDQEEGEVAEDDEEDEDVAMEIESNSSAEEDQAGSLEDAKARLLAQLDSAAAEDARVAAEEAARERARMNMRATVNMILTVAGEFYGQRDLLEFREPFVGM